MNEMQDLIRRQAANGGVHIIEIGGRLYGRMDDIMDAIGNLPSAHPEVKIATDTISRQAAILWVKTECNPYGKPTIDFESGKKVIEHLEQMPSAQTAIIHCRDCKNWDKTWINNFSPNHHYCPMVDGVRKDNFYCADAERREE